MNQQDTDKLVKFLNLTQSDNDHEALAAIRKANEILKKNGITWDDFNKPKGNRVYWNSFYDVTPTDQGFGSQQPQGAQQQYQDQQQQARSQAWWSMFGGVGGGLGIDPNVMADHLRSKQAQRAAAEKEFNQKVKGEPVEEIPLNMDGTLKDG